MLSLYNILIVITALLVSVQSLPQNVGRISYIYDPNSIPQNEKMLRLFIQLASQTAEHLVSLKNETKCLEQTTPSMKTNTSNIRIELSVDDPERIISGQEHYDQDEQPRDQSIGSSETPKEIMTKDLLEVPVKIENQMMISVEGNNNLTKYSNGTRNGNDTKTQTHIPDSSHQEKSSLNNSESAGQMVLNHETGSDLFHTNNSESHFETNTLLGNVGLKPPGSAVLPQMPILPILPDKNVAASIVNSIDNKESKVETDSGTINSIVPNFESRVENAAEKLPSVQISNSDGLTEPFHVVTVNLGNQIMNELTRPKNDANSGIVGLIEISDSNKAKDVLSSSSPASISINQGLSLTNSMQEISALTNTTELSDKVSNTESKVGLTGHQDLTNSESDQFLPIFDLNKIKVTVSGIRPPSVTINQSPRLENSMEGISTLADAAAELPGASVNPKLDIRTNSNATTGSLDDLVYTGSNVHKEIQVLMPTTVHVVDSSTGSTNNLLGGLAALGSWLTGSKIVKKDSGSTDGGNSSQHIETSPSSTESPNISGGFSKIRSKLIKTFPLFRSLPELDQEAHSSENIVSPAELKKEND